jgi:hypothetical protein
MREVYSEASPGSSGRTIPIDRIAGADRDHAVNTSLALGKGVGSGKTMGC